MSSQIACQVHVLPSCKFYHRYIIKVKADSCLVILWQPPVFVQAYAPYTSCPSGVTIVTRDGQQFSGSSIESAAYNPSLGPFQAAVVAAVVGECRAWRR